MGREEGSGWGTRVYLWWIHVDIWQNQYNIVKLKNKIKKQTKDKNVGSDVETHLSLVSGKQNGETAIKNGIKSPQKITIRIII